MIIPYIIDKDQT